MSSYTITYIYLYTLTRTQGTTNKKEWDTFTRECKNRKLFPVELSDYYDKNKTDLFNLWLSNGKDLQKHLFGMTNFFAKFNNSFFFGVKQLLILHAT